MMHRKEVDLARHHQGKRQLVLCSKKARNPSLSDILRDCKIPNISMMTFSRRLNEIKTWMGTNQLGGELLSVMKVNLFPRRKIRIRRTRTEKFHTDCIAPAVQQGDCAIMIWGVITSEGPGDFCCGWLYEQHILLQNSGRSYVVISFTAPWTQLHLPAGQCRSPLSNVLKSLTQCLTECVHNHGGPIDY